MTNGRVLVLSGVSGSGKTAVGRNLAQTLGWRFIEGDRFHSDANREKMQRGEPLNNTDRLPWLQRLHEEISACLASGERAVLACSALKKSYRLYLSVVPECVRFVLLSGDFKLIQNRLQQRRGHFMNPALLRSQFDALEISADLQLVDIDQPIEHIVSAVIETLGDWTQTDGEGST